MNHTLTLRRNLISLAIFNSIFFKLVVAYFFWATLYSRLTWHAPIVASTLTRLEESACIAYTLYKHFNLSLLENCKHVMR